MQVCGRPDVLVAPRGQRVLGACKTVLETVVLGIVKGHREKGDDITAQPLHAIT